MLILFAAIFALANALIARNKNRNILGWTFVGACLGFVGMIILYTQPDLTPDGLPAPQVA